MPKEMDGGKFQSPHDQSCRSFGKWVSNRYEHGKGSSEDLSRNKQSGSWEWFGEIKIRRGEINSGK